MKEIVPAIAQWFAEGKQVALATVVQTWGSAPRRTGAKMAMTPDGQLVGSVSGGCVEGAVIEEGQEVFQNGTPKLLQYGVADETAWDVGLACGGTIGIFVEILDPYLFQFMLGLVQQDNSGAMVTVIQGADEILGHKLCLSGNGERWGSLGADLDIKATAAALQTRTALRLQLDNEIELFIDPFRPAPQLIIVGGVHIAVALTTIAKNMGFRTIVVDPRRTFGSENRFPHADMLIQAWPGKAFAQLNLDESTAVALLTHDPKIDDPALEIALSSDVFYIGALGSSKTNAARLQRLKKKGLESSVLGRIHAPIGLDIGAQTPEEIALAVMAQIIGVYRHSFAPVKQQNIA